MNEWGRPVSFAVGDDSGKTEDGEGGQHGNCEAKSNAPWRVTSRQQLHRLRPDTLHPTSNLSNPSAWTTQTRKPNLLPKTICLEQATEDVNGA